MSPYLLWKIFCGSSDVLRIVLVGEHSRRPPSSDENGIDVFDAPL